MEDQTKEKFYGWKNLVILFICYSLIYGTVFYAYSVMFSAMVKSMGWARGDASIAHTIRGFMVGFMSPVVGWMVNRWGVRNTMMAGCALTVAALVFLGTMVNTIFMFIIGWGLMIAIGTCICGLVPVNTSLSFWFSKNRGTAIGLVSTGGALGGFVAQPLFTWVISATGQWQMGWLACAGVAVLGMIGLPWLKNKPADYGQYPDGINPEKVKTGEVKKRTARTYRATESWTVKEATKTKQLWMLILMYCAGCMPLFLVVTHGTLHLLDLGFTKMQAAYAIGFVSLFSACGRFPMGFLADIIEPRYLCTLVLTGVAVSLIGIWHAPNLTILIISCAVFGVSYGAEMILTFTMTGNYFSEKSYASISGFSFPFQIGGSAIVPVLAGYLFDYTKSYSIAFIILSAFAAIMAISMLFAVPPTKKATTPAQ